MFVDDGIILSYQIMLASICKHLITILSCPTNNINMYDKIQVSLIVFQKQVRRTYRLLYRLVQFELHLLIRSGVTHFHTRLQRATKSI
jgi:hypothetical protein